MDTNTPFHQAYHGHTTVHPVALAILLLMGAATIIVPRRYAVWPIIFVSCFVTPAQRVVIAGADFNFLRLMIVVGWIRVIARGEANKLVWGRLDTAFTAWTAAEVVLSLIRMGLDSLANKLGFALDAAGMYLMLRIVIRDWDDVRSIARGFARVAVPVAVLFLIEFATARNVFAAFGGVTETTIVRDGRLRCQGAFAHPILAGLYWASVLPLMVALFADRRVARLVAGTGVGCALAIIIACASASPITAVGFACLGGLTFFCRYRLRWIRWGVLLTLVTLHLVMKAPVWHLISRFDIVGGSSGYHRFQLIDGAVRHVDEWWLIGSSKGTAHWGHFTFDVTNYYLVQGLHGGLLLLVLFIALIVVAFSEVGSLWRAWSDDRSMLLWSWSLGVALFVHTTSFLVISYFGQMDFLWYLLLAIIGSMREGARPPGRRRAPGRARAETPAGRADRVHAVSETHADLFVPTGGD
jgi:hypothetical protein